jgi:hypothetical protein
MKRKFKIRFHLGQGENFMKWRIEDTDTKTVSFFEPTNFRATIYDGKLYNQKSAAKKINDGANKTVCAWIMAKDFKLSLDDDGIYKDEIKYNPRTIPNWVNSSGENIDKKEYKIMYILNKKIVS